MITNTLLQVLALHSTPSHVELVVSDKIIFCTTYRRSQFSQRPETPKGSAPSGDTSNSDSPNVATNKLWYVFCVLHHADSDDISSPTRTLIMPSVPHCIHSHSHFHSLESCCSCPSTTPKAKKAPFLTVIARPASSVTVIVREASSHCADWKDSRPLHPDQTIATRSCAKHSFSPHSHESLRQCRVPRSPSRHHLTRLAAFSTTNVGPSCRHCRFLSRGSKPDSFHPRQASSVGDPGTCEYILEPKYNHNQMPLQPP
mmetsp:Transcript_21686/g.50045  ORF Transcript_21686/g.50045 Transcript_21686/m.50045 type:complete len:257 (+) Transcript_21686:71-841(+)